MAEGQLDPRMLLYSYLTEPETLTLTDRNDPNRRWTPHTQGSKPEWAAVVMRLSKALALRALVGPDKIWKDSPALHEFIMVMNP